MATYKTDNAAFTAVSAVSAVLPTLYDILVKLEGTDGGVYRALNIVHEARRQELNRESNQAAMARKESQKRREEAAMARKEYLATQFTEEFIESKIVEVMQAYGEVVHGQRNMKKPAIVAAIAANLNDFGADLQFKIGDVVSKSTLLTVQRGRGENAGFSLKA